MKQSYLLVIITLLVTNICVAQQRYGNWLIEDGNVIFEKIYEADSSTIETKIESLLKTIASIKDIRKDANSIYCDLLDYVQVNNNPMMTASQNWRGRIIIEVKGNRYRVRAMGLVETVKYATFQGTSEIESTINDVLLKKNKPEFKTSASSLDFADKFGKELEVLFALSDSKKSDW